MLCLKGCSKSFHTGQDYSGRVGGWVVGWVRNAGNKAYLSPASAGTWAELGKIPEILKFPKLLKY